jgi:hypothetical protein
VLPLLRLLRYTKFPSVIVEAAIQPFCRGCATR